MDQPTSVAFTAFADVWPRATETEIGATLCAIGTGRTLNFFDKCAWSFSIPERRKRKISAAKVLKVLTLES